MRGFGSRVLFPETALRWPSNSPACARRKARQCGRFIADKAQRGKISRPETGREFVACAAAPCSVNMLGNQSNDC